MSARLPFPSSPSRGRAAVTAAAPGPLLAPADTLPGHDLHRRPWPGREITVDGMALHVRETPGPDPAGRPGGHAVYVHGLAGSATNWTDLAGLLAGRAAGTAVDLPGFGRSRPLTPCDYTPEGHAGALLRLLESDAIGRGPVHLLGNSLGGVVALRVAARRPDLVATLTLVSPAMPDLRPDPRRLTDPRLALALLPGVGVRARAGLARMSPRERAEQVIRTCFGDPRRVPEHRLDEAAAEIVARAELAWAGEAVDRSMRALLAGWLREVLGGAGNEGLWAVAARVRAPTLVVWGDRDRLVSPRLAARTAAAIPGSRLLMLPGVGHVAQIEAPEQVARAVAGLWDAHATGDRAWEDPARPPR